jgi:hypothetical protein
MAEAALKEQTTDIVAIVEANPVSVLTDEKTYADFYRHVEEEVKAFEPDLSTATGRKAIASLAYKITRTKTAIDNAGKELTEAWRKQTNKVNEKRRKAREEFEALAAQARRPLNEWEEKEEKRVAIVASFFDTIRECKTLPHGATSEVIRHHLTVANDMKAEEIILQDRTEEGERALSDLRESLTQALAAAEKSEADALELERLRAENEARLKAEREAAEQAERDRLAKEAADRAAEEAKRREEAAAERARADEKRLAEEAIAKAEREKQEAIDKAEAEKLALIREQERKEAARQAEIDREAAEQVKREANKKHRAKLTKEAETAIREIGIHQDYASLLVAAIIDGKIPHIKMEF